MDENDFVKIGGKIVFYLVTRGDQTPEGAARQLQEELAEKDMDLIAKAKVGCLPKSQLKLLAKQSGSDVKPLYLAGCFLHMMGRAQRDGIELPEDEIEVVVLWTSKDQSTELVGFPRGNEAAEKRPEPPRDQRSRSQRIEALNHELQALPFPELEEPPLALGPVATRREANLQAFQSLRQTGELLAMMSNQTIGDGDIVNEVLVENYEIARDRLGAQHRAVEIVGEMLSLITGDSSAEVDARSTGTGDHTIGCPQCGGEVREWEGRPRCWSCGFESPGWKADAGRSEPRDREVTPSEESPAEESTDPANIAVTGLVTIMGGLLLWAWFHGVRSDVGWMYRTGWGVFWVFAALFIFGAIYVVVEEANKENGKEIDGSEGCLGVLGIGLLIWGMAWAFRTERIWVNRTLDWIGPVVAACGGLTLFGAAIVAISRGGSRAKEKKTESDSHRQVESSRPVESSANADSDSDSDSDSDGEMMKIGCPHCDRHIKLEVAWAGLEAECPHCEQSFIIPDESARLDGPELNPEAIPSAGRAGPSATATGPARDIDLNTASGSLVYVNQQGEFVLETDFVYGSQFSEGLAHVSLDRDWREHGFINLKGEMVIRLEKPIEADGFFSNGVVILRNRADDTRGAMNAQGEMVIPFGQFGDLNCLFTEGLCGAKLGKGRHEPWGFINLQGEFVISPRFKYVSPLGFADGLVCVGDGRDSNGFADRNGEVKIPETYFSCGPFSEGLASFCAKRGELSGIMDTSGAHLISPRFGRLSEFSEGLAEACVGEVKVGEDSPRGYIDRSGSLVIAPAFDHAGKFREGIAPVVQDGVIKFINTAGDVVVNTQVEETFLGDEFGDGCLFPLRRKS